MIYPIWQATVQNQNGDIVPAAQIRVINEATGLLATIYSTRTGGALANPFFATNEGFAQFFAPAGTYRIIAKNTITLEERTWNYVKLIGENVTVSPNIDALRSLEPTFDGQQVQLLGHTVAGIGGGVFYSDYSSVAADDNGVTVVATGGKRWIRKLDGVVIPDMFGALPLIDSTVPVQSAIDTEIHVTGSSITYNIGSVMLSNNTLSNCNFVLLDSMVENAAGINVQSNSVLSKCTLNGNKLGQTNKVNGVSASGENIRISDNTISDTSGSAISLVPPFNDSYILDNTLIDLDRRGITYELDLVIPSYRTLISGNTIRNTGSTGISLISGEESTGQSSAGVIDYIIDGNTVDNTGLLEVAGSIGGYSANNLRLVVSNNTSSNIRNHGHHIGGNYCSVINNTIDNVANSGILIRNFPNNTGTGASETIGNKVSGNTITNVYGLGAGSTSHNGICVSNSSDFIVSNNVIEGVQNVGIRIDGLVLGRAIRAKQGSVTGNNVKNAGESLGISDTSEGILVINADNIIVSNNSVNSSYRANIKVSGSTGVSVSSNIATNSITDNGVYFVQGLSNSEKCTITGNTARDNNQFGIRLSTGLNRMTCTGNTAHGNGVGDFFIGTLTSSVVRANTGYRSLNNGAASVQNLSMIAHFLSATPTYYSATATVSGHIVSVQGASSTHITILLTDAAGVPIVVNEPVLWMASCELN